MSAKQAIRRSTGEQVTILSGPHPNQWGEYFTVRTADGTENVRGEWLILPDELTRADEVSEGAAVRTSPHGWCPVVAVHVMPKTVRLGLLTPIGVRTITPRRDDMLTVQR